MCGGKLLEEEAFFSDELAVFNSDKFSTGFTLFAFTISSTVSNPNSRCFCNNFCSYLDK